MINQQQTKLQLIRPNKPVNDFTKSQTL